MAISSVGLANMGYWGVLPMGIANYGGDTQVYTVPDYMNTNINLGFNSQAMASLSAPFLGTPCQIPQVQFSGDFVQNMTDALWQPVIKDLAQSNVNSIGSTIQATKSKLNSLLQTEGISDEDKEKVKALLDRLDEQEKKLKDLQEAENLTNDEVYDRSKEIEKAMRDIAAETAQLNITPKKANEPQGAEDNESATAAQQAQQSQASQQPQQTQQTQQTAQTQEGQAAEQTEQEGFFVAPEYAGQRAELEAQMQQAIDQQTGGVRSAEFMAQEFRDAVNHTGFLGIPGTDDEKFNAVCMQINKDNVMDLMLAYNQSQSTEDGESFMEAFMYDADHEQKAVFGKQIANALKEKAMELGLYDQCKDDFAKIYSELDDISINNDIYENYDNIIEKLANATGNAQYAKPDKKSGWEVAGNVLLSPVKFVTDTFTEGPLDAISNLCSTIADGATRFANWLF
ncbi:MAG: hypothetical protein NC191_05720 [Muribaculaceae bacterium]|nr:hypothetical protein [Muribaculaceae bacterium]